MSASPPTAPSGVDWGIGRYEHTAAQLMPAARVVVDHAELVEGEHVVDIGCGTGNAALMAAVRGARVTGVDPATRLLDVARDHASVQGLYATFVAGSADALPIDDGAADVAISVFGVVFAPDAVAAAAEMARVTAPDGRIVFSAWIPEGPISESGRVAAEAIHRALDAPARQPFAWHNRGALAGLFETHGFEVEIAEKTHTFTASSPAAYIAWEFESHPLWIAGRALLEPRGEADDVRARALEILEAGNEDPAGFRVTSRYIVAMARRRQGR
jgi:SAM-dependent methyltransferase